MAPEIIQRPVDPVPGRCAHRHPVGRNPPAVFPGRRLHRRIRDRTPEHLRLRRLHSLQVDVTGAVADIGLQIIRIIQRAAGGGVPVAVGRKQVVVVTDIHMRRQCHLFQVAAAGRLDRRRPRFGQRRQKHAGQDGDDRNHDQKFYQGEKSGVFSHSCFSC
ncbi:hypothetical protein SDC9_199815 [bioreactor metagenome]|uniref:Uncharacterized protein n=1 Tax=bioreactor metagenome TaxID=1076179 RepID=A0A645ILJ2_9ZZZZ